RGEKTGSTRLCDEFSWCPTIADCPTCLFCSASYDVIYSTKFLVGKLNMTSSFRGSKAYYPPFCPVLYSPFIVQIIKPCLLGVYVVKQIVRFAVAAEVRCTDQCPARAKGWP